MTTRIACGLGLRAVLLMLSLAWAGMLRADNATPYPGTRVVKTEHHYSALVQRLEQAITANGMGLVARASASAGAAARDVKIPGNAVLMVFRNDYAVRMLAASLTYRMPSAVFEPYRNQALDALAKELDPLIEKIVADAIAQ